MMEQEKNVSPRSAEMIRDWMREQVATLCRLSPEQVDVRQTFEQCGLDSLQAGSMMGNLEEWMEQKLAPSLIYDFPTIDLLAAHLAGVDQPSIV